MTIEVIIILPITVNDRVTTDGICNVRATVDHAEDGGFQTKAKCRIFVAKNETFSLGNYYGRVQLELTNRTQIKQ